MHVLRQTDCTFRGAEKRLAADSSGTDFQANRLVSDVRNNTLLSTSTFAHGLRNNVEVSGRGSPYGWLRKREHILVPLAQRPGA
jgi:hypothetical protein